MYFWFIRLLARLVFDVRAELRVLTPPSGERFVSARQARELGRSAAAEFRLTREGAAALDHDALASANAGTTGPA